MRQSSSRQNCEREAQAPANGVSQVSSVRRVEIRKRGEANRDLAAVPLVSGAQSVLGAGEMQTLLLSHHNQRHHHGNSEWYQCDFN